MRGISRVFMSAFLVMLGFMLIAILYYSAANVSLVTMEGYVRVSEMAGIEILGMSPDGGNGNVAVIVVRSVFKDSIPYEGPSCWQVFIDRRRVQILELNPPSGALRKGDKLMIKVDFTGLSWDADHEIEVYGPKGAKAKFIWLPS